jgi:hypothetical protein
MDIAPSHPQPGQPWLLDERHGLVVSDHHRRGERGEQFEHLASLLQQTEANFANHVPVARHVAISSKISVGGALPELGR